MLQWQLGSWYIQTQLRKATEAEIECLSLSQAFECEKLCEETLSSIYPITIPSSGCEKFCERSLGNRYPTTTFPPSETPREHIWGCYLSVFQAGAQSRAQLHFVTSSSPSATGTRSSKPDPSSVPVSEPLITSLKLPSRPFCFMSCASFRLALSITLSEAVSVSGAARAGCRRQDLPAALITGTRIDFLHRVSPAGTQRVLQTLQTHL